MKYDFQTIRKRYGTGSKKWGEMEQWGVKRSENIVPFSVADMEFPTAPEIVESIQREAEEAILGYANPTEEYLISVCQWMEKRHGWSIHPDWILPSHGVVDAFFAAVKAYTKSGDGVMLLTPVYYPMYHAVNDNGRRLVECPLAIRGGRYEIDFELFERLAAQETTKLFILCSPHNPGGRVWSREELERIGEICLRHDVFVVSDEIHFDLIMPGYHHTVFALLSEEIANHCIVCTAPSKTFNLAGLQTSNIIIPNPKQREIYLAELKRSNPNPKCNILGYTACQAAYQRGEGWLEEAVSVIDANRSLVTGFMSQEFPQIQVMPMEGTYLLWMDWRGLGIGYRELERINRGEARLFFDEGYLFGTHGQGFERWNLACPTHVVEEALKRMKETYRKYMG